VECGVKTISQQGEREIVLTEKKPDRGVFRRLALKEKGGKRLDYAVSATFRRHAIIREIEEKKKDHSACKRRVGGGKDVPQASITVWVLR